MRALARVGALVSVVSLGCSSLIPGYGRELVAMDLKDGASVQFAIEGTGAPLDLWIEFDVQCDGGPFDVRGDLDCGTTRSDRRTFPIALRKEGRPTLSDGGHQTGTLRVAELGTVARGASLRCRGAVDFDHGSSGSVRLIVTD